MAHRRTTAIAFFCVAGAALLGCPPPPNGAPDGSSPDATNDVWTGMVPVFGACAADRQCALAEGVACLTSFPGGLCTRRCNTDRDCGAVGHCEYNVCLPACTSGGGECRFNGGACETYYDGTAACAPVCYAAGHAPPGALQCPAGTECDAYSNSCTASPVSTGADNGDPCRSADDCRSGLCLLDYVDDTGLPTGYFGGYCYSFGLMPFTGVSLGGPIPQSTCPPGSVVSPFSMPGDLAPCFRACTDDSGCRAGYYCERLDTLSPPGFTNGICLPIECAQPGRTCAPGSTCVMAADGGTGARCGLSP